MRQTMFWGALLVTITFLFCSVCPAIAVVTVNIYQPTVNQFTGQDVYIAATASSVYETSSAVAEVEGRTIQLSFSASAYCDKYSCYPGWIGTLNLSGLSEGAKTLTVTATDYIGDTGSKTRSFIFDNKPSVVVNEPITESVATPTIHIVASCSDTVANCASLKVFANSTLLATGTNSLDQDISLSAYNGSKIALNFVGTDSKGQTTTVVRNVLVESSGRLHRLVDAPGAIWDFGEDGRALYLDTTTGGNALKIADTSNGATTIVLDQAGKIPKYGFLAPKGAIFMEQSGDVLTSIIYNLYNGTLTSIGYPNSSGSLVAKGSYAIWNEGKTLKRINLSANQIITISSNAGNTDNDLDKNGNVAFWSSNYQIMKYNGITSSQLTNDMSLWNVYTLIDGDNILYKKLTPCCSNQAYSIALFNATSGESILSQSSSIEPQRNTDYLVNSGWIAFTKPGTSGSKQVWLRQPDGSVDQITYFSIPSSIVSLSPNGELFFKNDNKLFFYSSAKGTIEISTTLPKPIYVNSTWKAIIGRSIFTIDTSPDATAPQITAFTLPVLSNSLTVPISKFSATDNVAVTGFCITETDSSSGCTWSTNVPANYIFSSIPDGIATSKTLYAWAKDLKNNISQSMTANVVILLPDVTKPTILSFNVIAPPNGATVEISSFTANDNVAISGYCVTEINNSSECSWSNIPQASHVFTTAGIKTLYAWVKDPANNISTSTNTTFTVTIDNTEPVVNTFTAPSGSTSLTIPVLISASDNSGSVAAYLITESSIAPLPTDSRWLLTSPIYYTTPSYGSKILYAWVKDAVGNVSNSKSVTVIFDATPPVISVFLIPGYSNSATIHITSLTANDNIGIEGWCLTETPDPSSCSWSSNKLSYYVFATSGSKTLYVFVKDAVGNMGAASALTVIDVPYYSLTLKILGSGAGSVHSIPHGISCASGECVALFAGGISADLIATPGSTSSLLWSGTSCSGNDKVCTVVMDADKSVTATFTLSPVVKIGSTPYSSIQDAYNGAGDNDLILAIGGVSVGALIADRPITVDILGGHDAEYNNRVGFTIINGSITIRSGSAIIDNITIK